ncbi:MAG: carbohydrate ABC transporter permease [Candidatus Bipolaricaulia bacterium]
MGERRRKGLMNSVKYLLVIIGISIAVFPYIYMALQSLTPWNEVDRKFIPTTLTVRSYNWLLVGSEIAKAKPWLRALLNSTIVTISSTLLMVFGAAIVGYALSKLEFRGRNTIYNFILFQMFYPAIILLVPTFLIVKSLGIYNTYLGMIIPKAMSIWAIFMYASFFRSVPNEMIDSARIDGASELRIILRIALPMSRSITTVIALFLFMGRWEELLWDIIVIKDHNLMTLNVLIATMKGPYAVYPGPMYAASVLLTLPILILFIAFSKEFAKGIKLVFK